MELGGRSLFIFLQYGQKVFEVMLVGVRNLVVFFIFHFLDPGLGPVSICLRLVGFLVYPWPLSKSLVVPVFTFYIVLSLFQFLP